MQQSDHQSGSCLACHQTHKNYCETGKILINFNPILTHPANASRVLSKYYCSFASKSEVFYHGTLKKVSTNKSDINKQLEIVIYLPKPEVRISLTV